MGPIDNTSKLVIKFEYVRYDEDFIDALELKFEKIEKVFIAPNEDNYDSYIFGAKIVLKYGKFIFVNDESLDVDKILTNEKFYYYISAEKLSYRFIENSKENKK